MPQQMRALLIGIFGPVLQLIGVLWDLLEHGVFAHEELTDITFLHLVSGPAHLIMATGFLVAVVCIPVALQVAAARPEELAERPEEPELEAELWRGLGRAEAAE